jgi:hypothetical protein
MINMEYRYKLNVRMSFQLELRIRATSGWRKIHDQPQASGGQAGAPVQVDEEHEVTGQGSSHSDINTGTSDKAAPKLLYHTKRMTDQKNENGQD